MLTITRLNIILPSEFNKHTHIQISMVADSEETLKKAKDTFDFLNQYKVTDGRLNHSRVISESPNEVLQVAGVMTFTLKEDRDLNISFNLDLEENFEILENIKL